MRKSILALALLLLAPFAAKAQVYPAPPNIGLAANRPVACITSNPGQPQQPQWYFATDTSVLSICIVTGNPGTWGQTNGGGGGGGIGGGGSTGFLPEWLNPNTLENSLCQDLSSAVLLCSESISVGPNAFQISKTNSASGTTQFLSVSWDSARNAITALPGGSVRGIAGLGAGTSGTVQIAVGGEYPWICDNQTVINDWLVESTTTAGQCHDAGATEPTGVQNIAQVAGANSGAGTATLADIFTPDTTNAPAGPPTVIQVNGSPLASTTANFNSTSPAAPSNNVNLPFATDGLSPSGISVAAPLATSSQPGIVQLSTDLGGSNTAPNVVGIQGIPCTLNGTPVAGQVWGFTSPTACANLFLGVGVRTFSIGTDTILSTDREAWVKPTTSGTVATTLPCSFGSNFAYATLNLATGTDTETPSGCNINGGASFGTLSNWFTLHAFDNTNYFAASMPTLGAFPSCADSAGNHLNFTSSGGITCGTSSGGGGLSGMTAGQVPIAATASTVTSSKAIQGTDTNLLSSGTVSGTGASLCTDANGGATTSGCTSGGYNTIDSNGSAVTQRSTLNFIPAGSANVSCVDNSGATRTDCTVTGIAGPPSPAVNTTTATSYTLQNSDNTWRDVFTATSAVAVTLPQAGQITSSPFVATRYSNGITCTATCATTAYAQNASDTMYVYITYGNVQTISNISDTAGDTFVQAFPNIYNFDPSHYNLAVYRVNAAIASASNTLTVTLTGAPSGNLLFVAVLEYSVLSFDNSAGASAGSSPPFPSATVSVSPTNAVALAFTGGQGNAFCQSGWTQRAVLTGVDFACEKLISSVATISYQSQPFGGNSSAVILLDDGIAGIPTFISGWYVTLENAGTNLVTVTPTTSTINGQTTLVIPPNEACTLMSDGTNYNSICHTIPNEHTNGVMGQAVEIAGVNTSNTGADVGATTLITTGASDAFYEVNASAVCRTSVAGTETVTITYTDTNSLTQTFAATTGTCNSTPAVASITGSFRAKASTNIQYTTTHASSQPSYDVSVAVYQLSTK